MQSGVKELNLIAQDITPYGLDTSGKLELPLLLEELAELPGLAWIRLLYAYPERLDSSIVETMARLDQVCKYLDIPLQHGSDHVLRRMGRKMTAENAAVIIRTTSSYARDYYSLILYCWFSGRQKLVSGTIKFFTSCTA